MPADDGTHTTTESAYVVRGDVSPEAITKSLQALLTMRHHPIARYRFTVLDTFDGRVRRAGGRLTRAGINGSATVEWQPRGGGSPLAIRLSQPVGFAWDLPEGPLQRALAPVIGVRRLLPLADAEAHGSLLEILDDRGKIVARLRVESGRARLPAARNGWQPLPTVITLTGLRGYADIYEQLIPVIQSRPGIEACVGGLNDVTLRQVGALQGEDSSSLRVELVPGVLAGVGARQIHLALLDMLAVNEPGLRADLDTEFLHDFRVTVRRTRSLLGQIRHVFPPDVVANFAAEFSWLGGLTGPPRDLDVLCLELRAHPLEDIPASDMEGLTAFLGQAQQQHHHAIVDALDSGRYRRLLSQWRGFLEQPVSSWTQARNAERLLVDVVSKRAWRLSRRIGGSAESVDERTAAARLHQVRIDAKKLRYLVDVTPGFYDAPAMAIVLSALKRLQRALGDFNDAHVQDLRLAEFGQALHAAGGPPGVLFALGRLAEQSRQRRVALRGPVIEALARFHSDDTRAACRRAFKGMVPAEGTR